MNVNERLAYSLGTWYVKRWNTGAIRALSLKEPAFNLPWERWDGAEEVRIATDWLCYWPDYESSLDALVRDVVPVLRARGMFWALYSWSDDYEVSVHRKGTEKQVGYCLADTPAAALSEAAAQALEGTE